MKKMCFDKLKNNVYVNIYVVKYIIHDQVVAIEGNFMSMQLRIWLASAVLITPSPFALAQEDDADGDEPMIIELIEVVGEAGYRATSANSATGLAVPIEELPVNIQVITSEVLADFQLLSQRDALQFHAAADDKRVRGFNTGEFFRNGFIHLSDTPGYTVERLEIIRGPSAVLNGPVTPGGAVNIISKKPVNGEDFGEVGTYWGVSGGDRDNNGINVDYNVGSLGGERGRGAFRFVGGFQGDTGFGTRADNESTSILPMLEYRPTDNTVIELEYYQYSINTDRTDRPMGIELSLPGAAPGEEIPLALAYDIDPRSSWFGADTSIEESLGDYTISIAHQFNDSLLGQFAFNSHSRDFDFGPGNRPRIDIFYRIVPTPSASPGSIAPEDFRLRRLTEDLFLGNEIDQSTISLAWLPDWGSSGDSHQLVGGVHVYDQNARLTIMRPRPTSNLGTFYFDFFNPANVETENLNFNRAGENIMWATVFARRENIELSNVFLNYHATLMEDRLSLLLGLTQSDISIRRGDPRITPFAWRTIADNDELLPQAGFVYDITDLVGIYANYSKSQLPDVNDPDFSTAPPVRIGEQVEVGVRFGALNDRFSASIGYFQIAEDLRGETTRDAEADGFEIDAAFAPLDDWTLIFSYASANTTVNDSSATARIGDPLVDEIPHKFALWSAYTLDNGWSLGGGLVRTGERVRPTAGAAQAVKKLHGEVLRYEPEMRVDLYAKYGWDNWLFSLNARNITQEVNLSNNVPRVPLQGGVKSDGSPYVFDGDMEVMVGLRYQF